MATVFFAAVCTACSVQTTVVLGNASSYIAVITYKDDTHKSIERVIDPGEKLEINHLLDVHFTIKIRDSIWNYERANVPELFIKGTGFGPFFKRVVVSELRNDKCIYLVRIDTSEQVPSTVQPPGFPLCPLKPQG
jgi:hypothetical protein